MSDQVRIKPAGHNLVRNPDTKQHLHKDGDHVVLDQYWRRRIKDGDVKIVDESPAPAAAKEKN